MKLIISTLFFFATVLGCSKDITSNEQGTDNPLENAWVKVLKNRLQNCTCKQSIFQATYNGQTVFYTLMTDPLCDGIESPALYDVHGNVVKIFPGLSRDFFDSVSDRKVIYNCKN